ncbi:MAG: diguanylate cyclase, partial [Gammaproteobacteria bacterium]
MFVGKHLTLKNSAVDPVGTAPKLRGYIAVTIDMSEVESFVNKHVISDSGYLFVTDEAGNVFFESTRRPVGASIPVSAVKSVLANEEELRQPLLTQFNGELAYISASLLLDNLYLYAVLPQSELHAISYELGIAVAAITLLTILITTLSIMVSMEYQIIRPIHRLGRLAREIGRGNWSIEVDSVKADDEIGELTSVFEDMAGSLEQSNEQIRFLAYHDSLTGLPNRTMFKEFLDRSIAHAKRNQQQLAMLFLDIDDFKKINDTMGHQAGD